MSTQMKQVSDTLKNNKIDQVKGKIDQKEDTTTNAFTVTNQPGTGVNPQVKPTRHYTPRRSYDNAYKARVLAAIDACPNASERSAFLRSEGLYYARICAWKKEQSNGKLKKKHDKNKPRIDHLTQENAQLKKKLTQAEAIIDLQKKVSELFGLHIQQHDQNESN
jgi:transposase